jgi:hypothetical protein
MNALVQELLVFVIVGAAIAYATLKFMPAAWRRMVASKVAAMAAHSGLSEANARRVEAKLSTGGACGSCDSCKACATLQTEGDAAMSVAATPSAYRSIPIRRA